MADPEQSRAGLPEQDRPDVSRLLSAWSVGTSKVPLGEPIPDRWRSAGRPDEVALLALATQYDRFTTLPAPPEFAQAVPLPPPPVAVLGEELRPLLVRVFGRGRPAAGHAVEMLDLLAQRGWLAHPFDLFPARAVLDALAETVGSGRGTEHLARCYRPWLLWYGISPKRLPAPQWIDPAAGDLAPSEVEPQLAERIRSWFAVRRGGLLRRQLEVALLAPSSPVAGLRRREALAGLSWPQLSHALGLEAVELASGLRLRAPHADPDAAALLACAARGAPVPVLYQLVERELFPQNAVGRDAQRDIEVLVPLLNRLPAAERFTLRRRFLTEQPGPAGPPRAGGRGKGIARQCYRVTVGLGPGVDDALTANALLDGPFADRVEAAIAEHTVGKDLAMCLPGCLNAVAPVVTAPVAERIRQFVVDRGVSPADPALASLTLNAALPPSGIINTVGKEGISR